MDEHIPHSPALYFQVVGYVILSPSKDSHKAELDLSCYKVTEHRGVDAKGAPCTAAGPQIQHWFRRTRLGVICEKAPAVTAIVANTYRAGTLVVLPKEGT